MKKSKNLKGKIGAVMLSLVLALTMVVTPCLQRKVYQQMKKTQKM